MLKSCSYATNQCTHQTLQGAWCLVLQDQSTALMMKTIGSIITVVLLLAVLMPRHDNKKVAKVAEPPRVETQEEHDKAFHERMEKLRAEQRRHQEWVDHGKNEFLRD